MAKVAVGNIHPLVSALLGGSMITVTHPVLCLFIFGRVACLGHNTHCLSANDFSIAKDLYPLEPASTWTLANMDS